MGEELSLPVVSGKTLCADDFYEGTVDYGSGTSSRSGSSLRPRQFRHESREFELARAPLTLLSPFFLSTELLRPSREGNIQTRK